MGANQLTKFGSGVNLIFDGFPDVFSQKIRSITLSRMKVCNFAMRNFQE